MSDSVNRRRELAFTSNLQNMMIVDGAPIALSLAGHPMERNPVTIFVSAFAACVIAIAPSASAQDERPWWSGMPGPDPRLEAGLLERVRETPASAFERGLPPIPLETWLFITLAPRAEVVRPRFVEWRGVFFCLGYASGENPSIAGPGPELCATGTVQFSAERSVKVVVKVADAVRDELRWRPIVPLLREVFIERMNGGTPIDSLDVPKLSDLPDKLELPFDEWPQLDFDTKITWDPPRPAPGQPVRFSLLVRNTGKRAADRAWITIQIQPCCDHRLDVYRNWFPKIAPGASVRVDWEVPLPEGRGGAIVTVKPGPSAKKIPYLEPRSSAVLIPPRE
jgi:hypothetical protein